ncbi:DUF6198 family protein [uncultured Ilyobacter sp.]|uniref:YczE/YyaS/YitT family protein n=1 Tax=uncultured Ilyobacter sp. TaxID=544433 RepID=UPI0029F5435E|nr:DUF6198 family protein [uncultured Ilyobacter sp.]
MIKKYIYYLFGVIFMSLGVTLTLISDLGAGGWDALPENLYKLTGISIGTWVITIALILLIVAAMLKREFINYKAFITSIVMGKLIDLFYFYLEPFRETNSFTDRILFLVFGLIVIGVGCAITFVTGLPKNHTETFVFSIVDTTKFSYQKAKTIVDISALTIAVIIGFKLKDFSNLGLGTIFNSFLMGTIIHYCMPLTQKVMDVIYGVEKREVKKEADL